MALKALLLCRDFSVKTSLEKFWNEASIIAPWISPENIRDPPIWMRVHFFKIGNGKYRKGNLHAAFVPILLEIIACIKSGTTEDVLWFFSYHCAEQKSSSCSLTSPPPYEEYISDGEENTPQPDSPPLKKPQRKSVPKDDETRCTVYLWGYIQDTPTLCSPLPVRDN